MKYPKSRLIKGNCFEIVQFAKFRKGAPKFSNILKLIKVPPPSLFGSRFVMNTFHMFSQAMFIISHKWAYLTFDLLLSCVVNRISVSLQVTFIPFITMNTLTMYRTPVLEFLSMTSILQQMDSLMTFCWCLTIFTSWEVSFPFPPSTVKDSMFLSHLTKRN